MRALLVHMTELGKTMIPPAGDLRQEPPSRATDRQPSPVAGARVAVHQVPRGTAGEGS